MESVKVTIADQPRDYSIVVGHNILSELTKLINLNNRSKIIVLIDSNAAKAWLDPIIKAVGCTEHEYFIINEPERAKSLSGLEQILDFFITQQIDKRSLIINIGGGALCDLAGFAASIYMRGVPFIHVPTTLLAQVDASIGGKLGINFAGVKNLIGAIIQPEAVLVDTNFLASLPPREISSGFAEIVKHGLIADKGYFKEVIAKKPTDWDPTSLSRIVLRSIQIKKEVIEKDQFEKGPRKILNFGHTLGHAYESLFVESKTPLLHGEAVAIGMLAEAYISCQQGKISQPELKLIEDGLAKLGLPISLPSPLPIELVVQRAMQDKKNSAGQINWSLLESIGSGSFNVAVSEQLMHDAHRYVSR